MQDQEINPTEPQNEKVEEQAPKPVKNEPSNSSNEKNWFEIVYTSVLGFFAAIVVVLLSLFLLAGLGYWCYEGYCRWFSTEGMYEDANHHYGLMSKDFVKVTEPVFSNITAKSEDVFFAEYRDFGLGVLINKNGVLIKQGGQNYGTFK